ncbi:MAG: OmpH family outer membrane protein [Trueperaceae bacterium]
MKRFLFIVALIGVLAFSATLVAQQVMAGIVFVDSQAAIGAHPAGGEANKIREQATTEIEALQAEFQTLADKANSGQELTADEQSRAQTLRTTILEVQQNYAKQASEAASPALTAVDAAIKAIAEENGYLIVMDSGAAGLSGTNLVVYAAPQLDITPQVIERVQAQ